MNSRGHFIISLIKSLVRMCGCGIALFIAKQATFIAVEILTSSLLIAELLGIVEELLDKRD